MYEEYKREPKVNPKQKANLLSVISFFYSLGLFKKGWKKDLQDKDIYDVQEKFKSQKLGNDLERIIKNQGKNCSVFNLIWLFTGKEYVFIGLIHLIVSTIALLLNPYLLSNILEYFSPIQNDITLQDAVNNALIFFVVNIMITIYYSHYRLCIVEMGIKIKMSLSSLIYRKCLKLSPVAISRLTTGNIITLLNKDVNSLEFGLSYINEQIIGLIHIVIVCVIIYNKIGFVTFIGVGVVLVIFIAHLFIGIFIFKSRFETAKKTDIRMQITQECLSAIKVVKMYVWEKYFINKISQARKNEMDKMKLVYYGTALTYCMGELSLKISFYILIMTYYLLGYNITAENVYFIISCFASLKMATVLFFPVASVQIADMKSAMTRIQKLLREKELPCNTNLPLQNTQTPKILFNKVTLQIENKTIIKKTSFCFESGLNLITGLTGSGKSSILKTILKELQISSGTINTLGTISYASEEPWVFPGSMRENILFGEDYNYERYQQVLEICALNYDLNGLNYRDDKIIGSRGLNISKGQQARIALARAVYRKSDIYLFDDCLSCLDVHVQDEVFNKCILNFLNRKLVVMVTNNQKYFKYAMKNLTIYTDKKCEENTNNQNNYEHDVTENILNQVYEEKSTQLRVLHECNEKDKLILDKTNTDFNIYKEANKEGVVDLIMYMKYIKLGGGYFVALLIGVVFIISQSIYIYSEELISKWVNIEEELIKLRYNETIKNSNYENTKQDRNYIVLLFSITTGVSIILYIFRSLWVVIFTSKVSVNIHKLMTNSIIHGTMDMFDLRLIGNILNRFSKDLATIDDELLVSLYYFILASCIISGTLILVISTNVMFLFPSALIIIISFMLRRIYVPLGRSLKRLNASTRSPIVGHLNDTLEGLITIRAFQKQSIVIDEFDKHQDLFTSAYHMGQLALRVFTFYLELLTIIFITVVMAVFLIFDTDATAGTVGLAITQAMTMVGWLQWFMTQWAEFENQMTAVERVIDYSDVKSEYNNCRKLENWPKEATIIFKNVYLKYKKTNEFVLKNINLNIYHYQKIGIVGRTGSGKSSIISCLLRLYDFEGTILIDNTDIKTISLDFLRSSIAIIPQDPVIFSGTLRSNIDPTNQYTDEIIWNALSMAELKNIMDLDKNITDFRNTFSSGQRQLICIARALVRNCKIIVLDEATANMDLEIDSVIHETIRKVFSKCTVFIIAHRLKSVMNCDKIIVLDCGEIIELGKPQELMENSESKFNMMVKLSEFYT